MRHFTRVAPIMPASIQAAAYADTEILFDWHKVEGFKGGAITGIQAIVRGTDGTDQAAATLVGMDLFFATSHIPTPNDGVNTSIDVAPSTLGTTGAAVDTPGWFNNLVGYVPLVAADMSDGDLIYLNMASKSSICIPVSGDLYVAAISKGAFDFRTTVQVNEANFAAGTQTVITVDTKDVTLGFAPGDIVHAVDDAVLGTIKTVDSATQITLTKANVDAIANNDVLYNVTPIQLMLSSED
tara:strand:- start:329 stop:1048 length:720 start_codon:yes stop_codon:yes gene_type:complete